jgi:hypothetical protein
MISCHTGWLDFCCRDKNSLVRGQMIKIVMAFPVDEQGDRTRILGHTRSNDQGSHRVPVCIQLNETRIHGHKSLWPLYARSSLLYERDKDSRTRGPMIKIVMAFQSTNIGIKTRILRRRDSIDQGSHRVPVCIHLYRDEDPRTQESMASLMLIPVSKRRNRRHEVQ